MALSKRTLGLLVLMLAGVALVGLLLWQGIAEHGAPVDPTDPDAGLSTGMVIVNSGILVFREGLETILVLAAVTASFLGAHAAYRRPVAAGAGAAMVATVITWFIVVAIIDAVDAPALAIRRRRDCQWNRPISKTLPTGLYLGDGHSIDETYDNAGDLATIIGKNAGGPGADQLRLLLRERGADMGLR